MYVLRRRFDSHSLRFIGDMLTEMSEKEFAALEESENPMYFRVHFTKAHKMVRDGHIHETGLWIDENNRIRYAKSDPVGIL